MIPNPYTKNSPVQKRTHIESNKDRAIPSSIDSDEYSQFKEPYRREVDNPIQHTLLIPSEVDATYGYHIIDNNYLDAARILDSIRRGHGDFNGF